MTGAGDLRHKIAWAKRLDVPDGYGNTKGAFRDQFTTSAKVQAKMGGEAVTAARLVGQQPILITVRQNSKTLQIDTDWRAQDVRTGAIYAVKSIADPDDAGAYLEILCQTGAAA